MSRRLHDAVAKKHRIASSRPLQRVRLQHAARAIRIMAARAPPDSMLRRDSTRGGSVRSPRFRARAPLFDSLRKQLGRRQAAKEVQHVGGGRHIALGWIARFAEAAVCAACRPWPCMTQPSDRAELDGIKSGLTAAAVCDAGTCARGESIVHLRAPTTCTQVARANKVAHSKLSNPASIFRYAPA